MLETVLCVDDDPITLMLCKKVIMKSNFSKNIYSAINGEDALKFFDNLINKQDSEIKDFPQLIFLDLNMPVMNGWEFLSVFSKNQYLENFITKMMMPYF